MERYNLDKPVGEQFVLYLKNLLHGDFGVSLKTGRDIGTTIFDSFKISARLGGMAALVALIAGLVFGSTAALMRNRWPDRVTRLFLNARCCGSELRACFTSAACILHSAGLGAGVESAESELCAAGHRTVVLPDGVHHPSDKDEHARCTRTGLCAYRPGEGSTAAAGYL